MNGSLSRRPDLVVTTWPYRYAINPELASSPDDANYQTVLVSSRLFIEDYRGQPVPVNYLLENGAVYVRRTSPEASTRDLWRAE